MVLVGLHNIHIIPKLCEGVATFMSAGYTIAILLLSLLIICT